MHLGLFMMPLHPPSRPLADTLDEDLELLVEADRLGYTEAWIGEHQTLAWEPITAPEIFIAKALALTRRIRLGPGVVLLQQHHPAYVANRIALLDHLARGRLNVGLGVGGIPTDHELLDLDSLRDDHQTMWQEAIEMVLRLWAADAPFDFQGKYWRVGIRNPRPEIGLGVLPRPFQKPHPPIGVAGVTARSAAHRYAGERGWFPMSINFAAPPTLRAHWDNYRDGARAAGRKPDRRLWRIARDIFVGETTEEARRYALKGSMARGFREWILRQYDLTPDRLAVFKNNPAMPNKAITVEYLVDNVWIVGDPSECVRRLRALHDEVGGFGVLLAVTHDWDDKARWLRSMELLAQEVVPHLP
jgi:alkanesulfonate monooxygenase SsuD/methylene tetrahydromethanopterin reductase-like flavin-dependent oxidoreductase (luciferase family)